MSPVLRTNLCRPRGGADEGARGEDRRDGGANRAGHGDSGTDAPSDSIVRIAQKASSDRAAWIVGESLTRSSLFPERNNQLMYAADQVMKVMSLPGEPTAVGPNTTDWVRRFH